MTNHDRVLKSRDITLPTKVHIVKTMVFPVVVYRCESWTRKKAEKSESESCSVMSSSLQLPWTVSCQAPLSIGSSSKNTGVGCHSLLQGIFLTQGSNPYLLCLWQWQMDSLPLSHLGNLLLIELNTHTDTQFIISQFPCVSLKSRHGTPGSSAQGLSGLKRCQPGL